ncbi:MAG TPA: transferrin receptor-like dimerization domain-containing protein [Thermoanaerobaculia bacterium]|jgi:N-acetylated-alpha-linked acidic dipeptidase|nr:transferrin receptor-like dimerization domain-containing protein [Thermoanaerobaculia bacterium]
MRKLSALLFTFLAASLPAQPAPFFGFSAASAEKERAVEAQFDAKISRDNMRAWMQRLSARPHHLGSAYGKDNAEFLAGLFRSWGYDTKIEQFDVLFPTPKTRILELIAPEKYTARLEEPAIEGDSTTAQKSEQLPTYNAYSVDGDVTGDLVYVNYGVPKDYDELEKRGVDVKGKIVIARYGGSWRGIKPKVAAEHGAVGCIIYSDPHDDGYFQGDVYPKGAFRNENGAQRGSVADMPLYPGDPLTPGVGATAGAKRLARGEARTITKIPVLPISYADALPLLKAMAGPIAPQSWRGALPITYHLGPGPARAHLKLEFDWSTVPARDVIARLPGADRADEWIVRGNHHDAWVNGADDPISGLVALLEEARIIGELAKGGWKPRRTLVFAAWDGEEPGLIGSTEWVEQHRDELREHAAVYINSDTNSRGFLDAGGSHSLERLVTEVARDVMDPQYGVSVLERLRALQLSEAKSADDRKEIRDREAIRLDALGSGSDYTPFLQFAGIASLAIGYSGEGEGGSYHSIYDSFEHYTRFVDPGFLYGETQTKTTGRMMLRLASADVLPLDPANVASTVSRYVDDLRKIVDEQRAATEETNKEIRERVLELTNDSAQRMIVPKEEQPVPYLDFAPLQNAVAHLQRATKAFATTNDKALMRLERALTREDGLPGRPWFKHYVYAPGQYTGYGVKTLPAVREAIELKRWNEANQQITVTAGVLEGYAAEVEKAATKP